ncbi:HD-GYP domain-containing protein [Sphingopyxis sp. OPL5]|uniref:HD-GYP domain-containing protein n=1 Tax=Sphingopyxis sp. OPL5 TaxID=2486273 RepID=UPI00164DA233|nr:HD-GYP domain-containing protein [Sphingopyxis sp. OPL5]QNO27469.1 HD-GYP domain-containing protein [Sphingopyxis sp. OPL5]
MLFRVNPGEVQIGMFIHAFEGRWIDHPFWRSRFLVETAEQLERIRASGVDALVIDRSRSRMAADGTPDAALPERRVRDIPLLGPERRSVWPAARAIAAASQHIRQTRPASYAQERRRAERVIGKSKQAVVDMFESARLGRAVEVAKLAPLARSIGDSIERHSRALLGLVRLKQKDEYTYLHSVAVCALMINFARHLKLDEEEVQQLGVAGLLHDVGKVAISDAVLLKPGSLDARERAMVEHHPVAGHALLAQSADIPAAALEVALHHHEKIDGTGYPDRLGGDALSLHARMGAICDVYDAVTSDRPYKAAWTPCEALTAMRGWTGHFDPDLLDRFADSLGIWPVGTLVRVSDGHLGIVMGSGGASGEAMIVRIFFDCDTLTEVEPADRSFAPSGRAPHVVGRDSPGFWRFDEWDAVRHRVVGAILS